MRLSVKLGKDGTMDFKGKCHVSKKIQIAKKTTKKEEVKVVKKETKTST